MVVPLSCAVASSGMLYSRRSAIQKLTGILVQSGMGVVLIEDEERMRSMVGSIEDAANNPNATALAISLARPTAIPTLSYSAALFAAVLSLLFP